MTLYADRISPETVPYRDRETGFRWTLAGRAVDGPLRGEEFTWVTRIQCRWHAWSAEYPGTEQYVDSNRSHRTHCCRSADATCCIFRIDLGSGGDGPVSRSTPVCQSGYCLQAESIEVGWCQCRGVAHCQ
ncbi:MAG: DUF3179 domain-containing protein [Fuerstiella sp.]|nr:DUF3179 domain-containing protein [Fuerstiella sp.]